MGVARAGRGRAVAVDVDPNVQIFFKILKFFSGGYPGFSQPAKTAYQHRERFGKSFEKSFAPMGRVWCDGSRGWQTRWEPAGDRWPKGKATGKTPRTPNKKGQGPGKNKAGQYGQWDK